MSDEPLEPYSDTAPIGAAPPPVSKARLCCGPCLVLVVGLFAIGGFGKLHTVYSKGRINGTLSRLDADGLGTKDLFRKPPAPNAAILIQPALDSMSELSTLPEGLTLGPSPEFAEALKHPTSDAAEAYLPSPIVEGGPQGVLDATALICERVDTLDVHVDAALAAPGCVFPIDWSLGATVPMPHLMPLKNLVNAYGTRAIFRQHSGDAKGAWEDAERLTGLANLEDEPTIISRLVRLALIGIACGTIDALLRTGPPPEDETRVRLDDALADLESRVGFTRGLRGELNMLYQPDNPTALLQGLDIAGGSDEWVAQIPVLSEAVCSYWNADLIEVQAELIRVSTLPPQHASREIRAIAKRAKTGSLFVQFGIPYVTKLHFKELKSHALLRMARTALALARESSLPAELAAPLVDPLSPIQAPIQWRRDGPNVGALWCVGEDETDDGGSFFSFENSPGSPSDPGWDLPFHLKLPRR